MIGKLVLVLGISVLLGACGHRPLKAPCEPGDAQPISSFVISILPEPLGALLATAECGPLRPL
jgi:hypothetical protein